MTNGSQVGASRAAVSDGITYAGSTAASVSVVMPALNEAENLVETVPAAIDVLEEMGIEYEVLVVDDGSTDGTPR